jgi:hypothetical protein
VLRVPVPFLFMALNITQMASDLAFMVGDLADEITMDQPDGRVLACVAGPSSRSRKLSEEGLMPLFNLEVTVQSSLLVDGAGTAAPLVERQKFTLSRNGLKYRIDKITDGADGAGVVFEAVQVTA